MTGTHQGAELAKPFTHGVEFSDGSFVVDAALLGELLGVAAPLVPRLMRNGAITSLCERGIDDDEGEFRLTFFYCNRRARISLDSTGHLIRRSAVNFGDRPLPDALRWR